MNDEDERKGETGGEEEAVKKPAVGFVEAACAVRLGEVGVETEQDAGDAESNSVVEDLAEGGGGDGEGGVGHVSDHDGVDDAHRHPADLRENERKGEREDGADLLTDGHGLAVGDSRVKTKTPVWAGVFNLEYQYSWFDGCDSMVRFAVY